MRATLTVSAPEGPSKPCKVTLKLWDVPRPLFRKLTAMCNERDGDLRWRRMLDDAVDIVCKSGERSVTLVKSPSDIHGLQARFENLLGKSLAYRIGPLQEAARKCAVEGQPTTQEGNLEGCSPDDIFGIIHRAAVAAANPTTSATKKQRKSKRQQPRGRAQAAAS
jgi:hypothetical protein